MSYNSRQGYYFKKIQIWIILKFKVRFAIMVFCYYDFQFELAITYKKFNGCYSYFPFLLM